MKRIQWQNIKRIKHAKRFAWSVAMNDSIFVVGGHNKLCSKSRFVHRYNPATNEWTQVENMHWTIRLSAENSGGIVERYDCANYGKRKTVRNEYYYRNYWNDFITYSFKLI